MGRKYYLLGDRIVFKRSIETYVDIEKLVFTLVERWSFDPDFKANNQKNILLAFDYLVRTYGADNDNCFNYDRLDIPKPKLMALISSATKKVNEHFQELEDIKFRSKG